MTCPRTKRRLRRPRKRREGAALLIVLFILLLATGTAVFALQSTQFEQRAAGSLRQAVRTAYVAEAATVGVLSLCYQTTVVGCADLRVASSNLEGDLRQGYALPNWGGLDSVYSVLPEHFRGPEYYSAENTGGAVGPMLASDKQIVGGGQATAYVPNFQAVMEKWTVPLPGEKRLRTRLVISTYGSLNFDGNANAKIDANDDSRASSGEFRYAHQTISVTRAFFDLK